MLASATAPQLSSFRWWPSELYPSKNTSFALEHLVSTDSVINFYLYPNKTLQSK